MILFAGPYATALTYRKGWIINIKVRFTPDLNQAMRALRRNGSSTKRRWGKCWRCRGGREIRAVDARLLHWTVDKMRLQISEWRGR